MNRNDGRIKATDTKCEYTHLSTVNLSVSQDGSQSPRAQEEGTADHGAVIPEVITILEVRTALPRINAIGNITPPIPIHPPRNPSINDTLRQLIKQPQNYAPPPSATPDPQAFVAIAPPTPGNQLKLIFPTIASSRSSIPTFTNAMFFPYTSSEGYGPDMEPIDPEATVH